MTREEREAAVDWFAMRIKLKMREPRNEAKGGWRYEPLLVLLGKLNDERKELVAEICADGRDSFDFDAIITEACDVAAYAMMIADRARHLQER